MNLPPIAIEEDVSLRTIGKHVAAHPFEAVFLQIRHGRLAKMQPEAVEQFVARHASRPFDVFEREILVRGAGTH
ncbi:hypothetical protein PQR02_31125 [Paraburkholderia sediminicola]|uniref:Uncharacterized protein n=1 Tax=Paraburkholderia rhynchosiae TaxID=487049 RepID=A0ACC7NLI8_9BURK